MLKCHSHRKSLGTDKENIHAGNLCIMKTNIRHQQKTIFSIKKYLPIQTYTEVDSEGAAGMPPLPLFFAITCFF